MLATAPDKAAPGWQSLPWVVVGRGAIARGLVRVGSAALRLVGARRLAADLPALAMALGWLAAGAKVTYVGEPRMASAEAGERMLEAHVEEALAQLQRAMRGQPPYSLPLLWSLRWVERS
jgi:succinate dehydrogenase/fumarate reductase flavoprotein subunit